MRWAKVFALVAAMGLAGSARAGQPGVKGSFGFGLGLGGPTSLNVEYVVAPKYAVDAGLDLGTFHGGWGFHADLLYHVATLLTEEKFSLPFYIGGGLEAVSWHSNGYWNGPNWSGWGSSGDFGLRVPVGLALWLHGKPLEFYVEAGPVLWFKASGLDLTAVLGFRYYL